MQRIPPENVLFHDVGKPGQQDVPEECKISFEEEKSPLLAAKLKLFRVIGPVSVWFQN